MTLIPIVTLLYYQRSHDKYLAASPVGAKLTSRANISLGTLRASGTKARKIAEKRRKKELQSLGENGTRWLVK